MIKCQEDGRRLNEKTGNDKETQKANQKPNKRIKEYEPKNLKGKSIKEIACLYYISPHKLLELIRNRISSVRVNSIDDRLNINQISMCKRIFDELWYLNVVQNRR